MVALPLCRTQNVLGEKGRRIRELTAVVQKRFGFPEGSVEVSSSALSPGGFRLSWDVASAIELYF